MRNQSTKRTLCRIRHPRGAVLRLIQASQLDKMIKCVSVSQKASRVGDCQLPQG